MTENFTIKNNFLNNLKNSAGIRLLILFGSFFFLLILVSIINAGIEKLSFLDKRDELLAAAAVQCFFAFIIPAILVARFISKRPFDWLGFKEKISIKNIVGILIVFILAMPGMEMIIEWNQSLHLPSSLSDLEIKLRNLEEMGASTTDIILQTHSIGGVITGILIVGVLTGLGEEMFFRGALQKIFLESNNRKTLSIFIAAFIFSFFHFQFFGFIPRMLMGIFFGYLLVWSKNIWLPVITHALNNSWVVVEAALQGVNTETSGSYLEISSLGYLGMASIGMTGLFLYFFKDYFFKTKDKVNYGKKEFINQL